MNDHRPSDQDPDREVDVDAAFRDIVARIGDVGPGDADAPANSQSSQPGIEIDLTDGSGQDEADGEAGQAGSSPSSGPSSGPSAGQDGKPAAGASGDAAGRAKRKRPATNPPLNFTRPRSRGVSNSPRSYELADDDGSFEPEAPPGWSSFSARTYLTWVPLGGSLVFLLFCAIFWRSAPTLLVYAAVALFLGGVAMLFTGLSAEHDHDDDGARF